MAERILQWFRGLIISVANFFGDREFQTIVREAIPGIGRPIQERVYSCANVGKDRPLKRPKFAFEQWDLYKSDEETNRGELNDQTRPTVIGRKPEECFLPHENLAVGHGQNSHCDDARVYLQSASACHRDGTETQDHSEDVGVSMESRKEDNRQENNHDVDIPLSELNAFLLKTESKYRTSSIDKQNQTIFSDITEMVEKAFRRLGKLYPIFFGSTVHKVGSVGEGTKVGILNEFDFMVELPALEDRLILEIKPNNRDNEVANCVTMTDTDFLLEFLPEEKIIKTRLEGRDAFGTIKSLILEELVCLFLPGWKLGPTFKVGDSEDKGKVRTIRLRYQPDNAETVVDVFLDFSVCVAFEWTIERRTLMTRTGTKSDLSSPNQRYCLLVRDTPFWFVTTALREKDKLCNSELSPHYKRVYRLAKMLTKAMLPPFYDFTLDTLEAILPSYWLKQILLYMIDEFPDKSSWADETVGLQVYRLFERLDTCFQRQMLSNYFSPMQNHVLDNTKNETAYLAKRFVPVLASLLRKLVSGDTEALGALLQLEKLTSLYNNIVSVKSKRMRLLLLMLRYKGLVMKNRTLTESTKFFSRVNDAEKLYTVMCNYTQFHAASISLTGKGSGMKITESGKAYSLSQFIKEVRDDPLTFPDDWEELYDQLFSEHMPDWVRRPGPANYVLKQRMGEILRKVCGDRPKPLSAMEGFYLTQEFTLK